MSWNPLANRTPRQRNVIIYTIEALVVISVTVLSGKGLLWYVLIPIGFGLLAKISHHYASTKPQNIRLIESVLELLHKVLEPPKTYDVRCTLLTPDGRGNKLIQFARYSPSGEGLTTSEIPVSSGVAGECFRTRETVIRTIEPDTDFLEYMMREEGFSRDEARKFSPDRKSYLCSPIVYNRTTVLGVLSLDSKEPGIFDDNTRQLIERCFSFLFLQLLRGDDYG